MGLETEFVLRFSPSPGCAYEPTRRGVSRAILDALEQIVAVAPGEREGFPQNQRFVQNGGAFAYEVRPGVLNGGLLESATPECRTPAQLLLYQRAQEALILRALPRAARRLAERGFLGELAIIKNCRDSIGNVYGVQENYEVRVATGWRLFVYRLGLGLILPLALSSAAVFFVAALLAVLLTLLVLLIFPLAWHWLRLDQDSANEPFCRDDDELPPGLFKFLAYSGLVAMSPSVLLFLLLLRAVAFRDIRRHGMAFLVSRIVMTGAGTLHADGTFGLSERAESVVSRFRTSLLQGRRSIIDSLNLAKTLIPGCGAAVRSMADLFESRQRLQISSDANCSQTAEFLKVGATPLVIDMAEAGFLRDAPRVCNPVAALKTISRDSTLRARVPVKGGGAMTALEIQQWYLRRAEEFLAVSRVAPLEYREVISVWRDTLQALSRDPSSAVGRVDWVTKRALLSGSEALSAAARKKIDIKYHELGTGYFALLERLRVAPIRVPARDVQRAIFEPPRDSPACQRAGEITRAGINRSAMRVSWRRVRG